MTRRDLRRLGAAVLFATAQTCAAAVSFAHDGHRGAVANDTKSAVPSAGHAHAAAPEPSTFGGPFEFTDHTGRPVSDRTFRGQWMLIFFGFTGCRQACPVGLENMTKALESMGPAADRIQPIFIDISLDEPDFKGLAQFVGNFHPRLLGLAGTRAQLFAAAREFKVRREYMVGNYSDKETGPRIDHTTRFYLVDPEGKTRAYFYHGLSAEEMSSTIRRYL